MKQGGKNSLSKKKAFAKEESDGGKVIPARGGDAELDLLQECLNHSKE